MLVGQIHHLPVVLIQVRALVVQAPCKNITRGSFDVPSQPFGTQTR